MHTLIPSTTQSVVTSSNVFVSSDYMYFQGANSLVSRMRTDLTDLKTIGWQTKSEIAVSGDHMYFRGMDDSIYSGKTDFTDLKTIGWKTKSEIFVSGDYMFFQGSDGHLWLGTTDFSALRRTPFAINGRVFVYQNYMYFRGTDNKLWKAPTTATTPQEGIHLGGNYAASDPFVGPASIPFVGTFVFFRGTDDALYACWSDGSNRTHIGGYYTNSKVFATDKYICFRDKNTGAGVILSSDGHERRLTGALQPAASMGDELRVFGDRIYYRGKTDLVQGVTVTLQLPSQRQQSPIALDQQGSVRADDTGARWLTINWPATLKGTVTERPDGGVTVEFSDSRATITVAGKTFTLKQYHLHHKAEHPINGEYRPIEMHAVHTNADGTVAVLGVTFKGAPTGLLPGPADQFFTEVTDRLNRAGTVDPTPIPVNPNDLLPTNKSAYYRYEGSLTTPPYSENVSWIVLNDAKLLAQTTIDDFAKNFGEHARWVQPLNRRVVLRNFL